MPEQSMAIFRKKLAKLNRVEMGLLLKRLEQEQKRRKRKKPRKKSKSKPKS